MRRPTFTCLALASAVLLAGCSRSDRAAAPASTTPAGAPGSFEAGRQVYHRVCFVCHLPTGAGVPGTFPPLAGSEIVAGDPARLIRIVLHGLQGPLTVHGTTFNSVMPPHGPTLNDAEIAAVLTYVRGSWGHRGEPVTAAAVTHIRATVHRPTPWTWPELASP